MSRRSSDEAREAHVRRELARLLRQARERAGLSQAALQARLAALGVENVAATTINRYERGQAAPTLGTLDALCELFTGQEDALVGALAQALGETESKTDE